MAYKCDHCGKGIQIGHNVSHSKRRTRKTWRPNLQRFHFRESMKTSRETVRLCVKCLRQAKDHMKKLMQKETIAKMQVSKPTPQATA